MNVAQSIVFDVLFVWAIVRLCCHIVDGQWILGDDDTESQ